VVLLYVRPDEVFTGMDCEKWFHLFSANFGLYGLRIRPLSPPRLRAHP
jgi:hypothetical protein